MPAVFIPHIRVAVGVKRTELPLLLLRARAIQAALASNAAQLPDASPTPAALLAQIQALEAAQQRTNAREPGAAADRDAAAAILMTSLDEIRTYVQGLCNASPEQAAQLVAAASMKVVVSTRGSKPMISATRGVVSGSVVLKANKGALVGKTAAMCTFNWQYSIDGQKTWVTVMGTPVADTTITELPALTTVSFRVSVTMRRETGAYCQPVSIIVH